MVHWICLFSAGGLELALGEVTRDRVPVAPVDQRRLFLRTELGGLPAPGAETAPGRWICGRRDVALENDAGLLPDPFGNRIRQRHGRQQGDRVGVARLFEDFDAGAGLD